MGTLINITKTALSVCSNKRTNVRYKTKITAKCVGWHEPFGFVYKSVIFKKIQKLHKSSGNSRTN